MRTLLLLLALLFAGAQLGQAAAPVVTTGAVDAPIEAPGTLQAGPVQGSPALQALLKSQAEELIALEARVEDSGGQERIAAAKAAMEVARLELLATEAQNAGRVDEAAAARAELARLRAPEEIRPLHWQERGEEVQP